MDGDAIFSGVDHFVDNTDILNASDNPKIGEEDFLQQVKQATVDYRYINQAMSGYLKKTKCF